MLSERGGQFGLHIRFQQLLALFLITLRQRSGQRDFYNLNRIATAAGPLQDMPATVSQLLYKCIPESKPPDFQHTAVPADHCFSPGQLQTGRTQTDSWQIPAVNDQSRGRISMARRGRA